MTKYYTDGIEGIHVNVSGNFYSVEEVDRVIKDLVERLDATNSYAIELFSKSDGDPTVKMPGIIMSNLFAIFMYKNGAM